MTFWPLYRWATYAATPLVLAVLARRVAQGKEERARIGERWGRAAMPRPAGRVVWLHGASVGESVTLLPLAERFLDAAPDIEVLITTGTVSSARIIGDRLPAARARHHYVPIDQPNAVRRFLDHWRPSLAVWIESEFWPNLLLETRARGIATALVNARMSDRSWRGWQRAPWAIRSLLGCFDLVLAQDAVQAERLRGLGAGDPLSVGDLKAAGRVAPVPASLLDQMQAAVAGRPVWLAASTHPGEEAIVADAHLAARETLPTLLTLLAPRHPARGPEIENLLVRRGLGVVRQSLGQIPNGDTDIWLVDTLGELGLFYRLAKLVLIAGSLIPADRIGGHNPLEAASLGAALLHGPDMNNAAASTASLDEAGAALPVTDAGDLARQVAGLLRDPASLARMGEAAQRVADDQRSVVDRVFERLLALLPAGHAGA